MIASGWGSPVRGGERHRYLGQARADVGGHGPSSPAVVFVPGVGMGDRETEVPFHPGQGGAPDLVRTDLLGCYPRCVAAESLPQGQVHDDFARVMDRSRRPPLPRRALIVHTQRLECLDTGGHIKIRPDVIFERQPGNIADIADSKYKITDDGYGNEADYYQTLAYTSSIRNLGIRLSTWVLWLDPSINLRYSALMGS